MTGRLAARLLVVAAAAVSVGIWQRNPWAGAAAFFALWALAVMGPGGGA